MWVDAKETVTEMQAELAIERASAQRLKLDCLQKEKELIELRRRLRQEKTRLKTFVGYVRRYKRNDNKLGLLLSQHQGGSDSALPLRTQAESSSSTSNVIIID